MKVEQFNGIEIYIPTVRSRNEIITLLQNKLSKDDVTKYEEIIEEIIRNGGSTTIASWRLSDNCRFMLIQDGYCVKKTFPEQVIYERKIAGLFIFFCLCSFVLAIISFNYNNNVSGFIVSLCSIFFGVPGFSYFISSYSASRKIYKISL